jgi:hypothetical protein
MNKAAYKMHDISKKLHTNSMIINNILKQSILSHKRYTLNITYPEAGLVLNKIFWEPKPLIQEAIRQTCTANTRGLNIKLEGPEPPGQGLFMSQSTLMQQSLLITEHNRAGLNVLGRF